MKVKFVVLFFVFYIVLLNSVKAQIIEKLKSKNTIQLTENSFHLDKEYKYLWISSEWVKNQLKRFSYDKKGNKFEELIQDWKDDNWINNTKISYHYDDEDSLIEEIWKEWIRIDWDFQWTNAGKFNYLRGSNGNIIELIGQEWKNGQWVEGAKVIYNYDRNSQLVEQIFQINDNNSWINYLKYDFTYDANGKLINWLWNVWYKDGKIWINYIQYLYTYDLNCNLIEELGQKSVNNQWINDTKISYVYDTNQKLTESQSFKWDNNWIKSSREYYSYDGNGNINDQTIHKWENNNWINDIRYTYDYIKTSLLDNSENLDDLILYQNNPNPADGFTTISFQLKKNTFVNLTIIDEYGNIVDVIINENKLSGIHRYIYCTDKLSNGIYFYKLIAGNISEAKKLIILK